MRRMKSACVEYIHTYMYKKGLSFVKEIEALHVLIILK